MVKSCKDCGAEKPLDHFYRHKGMKDGHLNSCKECQKLYAKTRRSENPTVQEYDRARGSRQTYEDVLKYRLANPMKYRAHTAVNNAVRDGRLLKLDNCEQCMSDLQVEGHHDDCAKPLEVRWLCSRCHSIWHAEHGEALNP